MTGENNLQKILVMCGSSELNGTTIIQGMFMKSLHMYTEVNQNTFNKGYKKWYNELKNIVRPIRLIILNGLVKIIRRWAVLRNIGW